MAKQKGTNIVALRKVFKERGEAMEQVLLDKLDDDLKRIYRTAMATTMTDVEKQTEIYRAAASTLFPSSVNPMHDLGLELADRSYTGIYRLFLRIPTPKFVISKAAAIYGTYYDKGVGDTENLQDNSVNFVLKEIPELPVDAVYYIGGHATKLLELAGAKNTRVEVVTTDPACWKLILNWE